MKMAFEVDGKEYQIRFWYPQKARWNLLNALDWTRTAIDMHKRLTQRARLDIVTAKKRMDELFTECILAPRITFAGIFDGIFDPIQPHDQEFHRKGCVSVGSATCSPKDTFVAETGRRLALERALENHTKAFRVEAWAAYNGRKGHKATLKDRIAWPSMKSVDVDAEDARALGVSELGDAHTDAIKKVLGSKNPQSSGTLPGTAVERAEFLNALRDALFDSIERSIGKLN